VSDVVIFTGCQALKNCRELAGAIEIDVVYFGVMAAYIFASVVEYFKI
jgi:hypothetical protein